MAVGRRRGGSAGVERGPWRIRTGERAVLFTPSDRTASLSQVQEESLLGCPENQPLVMI